MKNGALWVVVLEDQKEDSDRLTGFIRQFAKEHDRKIEVTIFRSGRDLLDGYKEGMDVLFMDIELLPGLNGMDTAQELRKRDAFVPIIFTTNMAQYALKGYEVDAIGFMVKPVHYYLLENYLTRAIARNRWMEEQKAGSIVTLGSGASLKRVATDDILYIVKDKNYIIYHMKDEEYRERGTMKDVLPRFEKTSLKQCQSGCLVNLRYVKKKEGNDVFMEDGEIFAVSLPFRKDFTQQLLDYLRGV